MGDERPPYPGSRPETLTFPFAEAAAVATAARELASDLDTLRTRMTTGLDNLAGPAFQGRFADWLLTGGGTIQDDAHGVSSDLHDQADEIKSMAATARSTIFDRNADIHTWEIRYQRWHNWTPS